MPESHDKQIQILVAQARMEEKIDNILEKITDLAQTQKSHGIRIDALEKGKAYLLGAVAVISFIITYLPKYLWKL